MLAGANELLAFCDERLAWSVNIVCEGPKLDRHRLLV